MSTIDEKLALLETEIASLRENVAKLEKNVQQLAGNDSGAADDHDWEEDCGDPSCGWCNGEIAE